MFARAPHKKEECDPQKDPQVHYSIGCYNSKTAAGAGPGAAEEAETAGEWALVSAA